MNQFQCGCPLDPQNQYQRCHAHRFMTCHAIADSRPVAWCPPCYRARLLGVHIAVEATPTRNRAMKNR